MITLLILQETDVYGYQLSQLIKEKSEGKLSIQEGAMYPMLYKMVDEGYISGRDETVETKRGRKRNRVVYHLEPPGREKLIQLKFEYDEVQQGMHNVFKNCKEVGYEKPD